MTSPGSVGPVEPGHPTASPPARRRAVLEQLAAASGAERRETTTVAALASALDADRRTVEARLNGLAACELARRTPDGSVRATVTGEELLALDTDELVIVDSTTRDPGR